MEASLGIVSLAISGPPLIEVLIRLGDYLVHRAKQHRQIGDNVKLCEQIISLNKTQSRLLLAFFNKLEEQISSDLQDEVDKLYQSLRNLYEDLIKAFSKNQDASTSANAKPAKFSSRDVLKIQDAVDNLETWNDRFLKFAIIIMISDKSDFKPSMETHQRHLHSWAALERVQKLREAVQATLAHTSPPTKCLLDSEDNAPTRVQLSHSTLWIIQNPTKVLAGNQRYLIETRSYSDDIDTVTLNETRRTVRDIALILREADPSIMGVLQCHGFRHERRQNRFELHFMFPNGAHNPRSLRDLLKDSKYKDVGAVHPLNHRLDLAKKLASAVFFIHSGGFVHKNIRPENIIIFEPDLAESACSAETIKYSQFPRALGAPYLVGYDGVRKVDAKSDRIAVDNPERGIYLSPERHRLKVGDEFTMQHDVYSLGVVLLELALWKDLTNHRSSVGMVLWDRAGVLKPYTSLHENLLSLAKTHVSRYLGQNYADAVTTCLAGLKDIETHMDQDGVVVGLAYITQVLQKLEGIVL